MINIKNFSLGFSIFALFVSLGVMNFNITSLKSKNINTTKASFNSGYIDEVIETNPKYKFKTYKNGRYYFATENGDSITYILK